jgi:hypothetical protein
MSKNKDILDMAAIDRKLSKLPENINRIWEKLGLTPRQYEMYRLFNSSAPVIAGSDRSDYDRLLKEELNTLGLAASEIKL